MLIFLGGGHSFVFEIKVFNHLNLSIDKAVSMEGNNEIYLPWVVWLMLSAWISYWLSVQAGNYS